MTQKQNIQRNRISTLQQRIQENYILNGSGVEAYHDLLNSGLGIIFKDGFPIAAYEVRTPYDLDE